MSGFNKEVADKYKSLFKGCSFNFEGLKQRTKEGFAKLVKDMGAKVSDDAEVTFVEKSYFQKEENNTRDNLYDINYIVNAVERQDTSGISNYKLAPRPSRQGSNDEPMCYQAQYCFKTDSCHKCYFERVFCKECAQSNEESETDFNQHAIFNDTSPIKSISENEDEILETPKKKAEENISDSSKRLISSESEDDSDDVGQNKFVNGKNKCPPRKKSRNSSDTDDTLYEGMSPEAAAENNDSKSNTGSSNNLGKEKNGLSPNKKSKEKTSLMKIRAGPSNRNENSIEDDDLSDSSINENKKQPQKVNEAKFSWIVPSKTAIPPPRKEKLVEPSDEDSDGVINIDNEEDNYFQMKKWWLPHDVPEKEQCTFPNCTFEPEAHRAHYRSRKFLSSVEKKILVKYLINNNEIPHAKGKLCYEKMITEGYLAHRSWETLRNCFRRTILREIETYNLETNILNKFLKLNDRSFPIIKKEKQ